ncbi:HAD family hydrolase [Streptomyces sp. NPDC054786]
MGGIEALVLDFGGTLADTTPSHEQALRAALRPHGLDLDHNWYRQHVGLSIHDLLAALPGGRQLPHDEIIRHSCTHLRSTVHSITPVPCVAALLHTARRAGPPCVVASGASRLLVILGIEALGPSRGLIRGVPERPDCIASKGRIDLSHSPPKFPVPCSRPKCGTRPRREQLSHDGPCPR